MNTKVNQFEGRNGAVKNQFTITTPEGEYFQSYDSVIVFKPNISEIKTLINWYNSLPYSVIYSACKEVFGLPPVWINTTKKVTGVYLYCKLNTIY